MKTFFEVATRFYRLFENGIVKKVTEQYLIDALSFTEAEARIIEEMRPYINCDFQVATIKRTNIAELIKGDKEFKDKWYKVRLNFISLNDNNIEKRTAHYLLVNENTIDNVHDIIVKHMEGSVLDYEIVKIDETKILDVFLKEDKTES